MRSVADSITISCILAGSLSLALLMAQPAICADWPQYRGPSSDGTSTEQIVVDGPAALTIVWQVPIGSGNSEVAVAHGKAVTMFSEGDGDWIAAFQAKTGKSLWRRRIADTYKGHDGSFDGPIGSPLIVENRVFALGPRGHFLALDLEMGHPLWQVHLGEDFGRTAPDYGFGASPVAITTAKNNMIVLPVGGDNQMLLAFHPKTGDILWRAGSDEVAYQTPILLDIQGEPLLMCGGHTKVVAFNPDSGTVLWEREHGGISWQGAWSLTPIQWEGTRFLLKLFPDESALMDFGDLRQPQLQTLWRNTSIKRSFNLPILKDGHLYGFSSRFLVCVDAATGETRWRSRGVEDGFLTGVGRHMVLISKRGKLHLAEISPQGYRELAVNQVFNELVWTHPSYADGLIFVRSLKHLAAVSITPASTPTASPATTAAERTAAEGGDLTVDAAPTSFHRFMGQLSRSQNPSAQIEAFLKQHESFPIMEENGWVHFVYHGQAQDMALIGDMLGMRREMPMKRVPGSDLFYLSLQLPEDARLSYAFLKNYENGILDPRNPEKTASGVLRPDMEVDFSQQGAEFSLLRMPKSPALEPASKENQPFLGRSVPGTLKSQRLESDVTYEVFLPPEGDGNGPPLPSLYIFLGKDHENERSAYVGIFNRMMAQGAQPFLAVLVKTQVPIFNPDPYAQMLGKELVPWIDKQFHTSARREARTVGGIAFRAVPALFAAFYAPEKFGRVLVHSPILWDYLIPQLQAHMPVATQYPLDIYMEWGLYDLFCIKENVDLRKVTRAFAQDLKSKGHHHLGRETHDGTGWLIWSSRMASSLQSLYGR